MALPRRYREDEWLRLELRAIGNQLTAVADGVTLGTITDESLSQPGGAGIFATNGWFKEIEYLPLDEGGVAPPPPPAAGVGQWRPVSFRQDELLGPGAHVMPDGTLKLSHGHDINTVIPCQNMALKGRLKRPERVTMSGLRLRTKGPTHVALHFGATEAWIDTVSMVPPRTPTIPLKPGQGVETPAELVFAVIGQRAYGSVDGVKLPPFELHSPPHLGSAGLWSMSGEFSGVAFMPLDGLSEAEALKATGLDGVAATAAPAAPTWQPAYGKPLEQLATQDGKRSFGGGWLSLQGGLPEARAESRQGAARVRVNWLGSTKMVKFGLRGTDIELDLGTSGQAALHRWLGAGIEPGGPKLPFSVQAGMEVDLQIAWLNGRAYGWVNGQLIGSRTMLPPKDHVSGIWFSADKDDQQVRIRDYEVVNLDALSEAEAQKLIGANP